MRDPVSRLWKPQLRLTALCRETRLAGKLEHRSLRSRSVRLLMRMITGSNQRTRLDMAETEGQRFIPQIRELLRCIEASNRQMISRRAKVLPDSENVNAPRS